MSPIISPYNEKYENSPELHCKEQQQKKLDQSPYHQLWNLVVKQQLGYGTKTEEPFGLQPTAY